MFKAMEDTFDNMHAGADEPMSTRESSANSLETYVNPDIDREESQPVEVVDVVTLETTLGGVIVETNEAPLEASLEGPLETKEEINSQEKQVIQVKKITRVTFFHSVVDELVNYFFSCSSKSATVEILLESSESPREVKPPVVEKSISNKKEE
jgi:hypothetical protein